MRFDLSTWMKRHRYFLTASALIACGVALRLALTLIGWPHTNSEEGTMGLEALHILQRGEHPIYLYGQHYMGVGEAYLGALAFALFGVSIVSLRLGMIAFYALFMLGVFWLAHLLYSRRVALLSLAVLVLGTPFLVEIELLADGGKAETLACGALMFALAVWLALSRSDGQPLSSRQRWLRAGAFVAWGIVAGFGLYTYAIIAPFVLASGVLLWVACRHELRGWGWAWPLAGLLIGLQPALLYTATAPLAQNPVAVFLSLHQSLNAGGAPAWILPVKQVEATLLYTLPTATGLLNLYPVQALPLYGPLRPATFAALFLGGGWSLGYLALLVMATTRPFRALRQQWTLRRMDGRPPQAAALSSLATGDGARHLARLLLALTAWITIATYMFSATAANNPHSGRYLIGLLVIVPAILWPLLDRTPGSKSGNTRPDIGAFWGGIWPPMGVALLAASLALGVVGSVQALPDAVAANYRDGKFARDLLSRNITRFHSDYWTCDLMNFATRERLTCAVVSDYGQPGLTRYPPYATAVQADPAAYYVLRHGSELARTFEAQMAATHQPYTLQYIVDGYAVYAPVHGAAG